MKNFEILSRQSQSLVSVDEVKNILRIEHSFDDTRIAKLINTSIDTVEQDVGFYISPVTCSATFDSSELIFLDDQKIDKIVSITSGSTEYTSSATLVITRGNNSFVALNNPPEGEVKITYTAGSSTVHGTVQQALEFLVCTKYEFTTTDKQNLSALEGAYEAYNRLIRKVKPIYL